MSKLVFGLITLASALGYLLITPSTAAANTQPIQATDFMSYNATTGKIDFKYDLNDSSYYTEVVPPPIDNCSIIISTPWACQSGDPSILFYPPDRTYYVTWREKTNTGPDSRMKYIALEASTDLINWSTVWKYHKDDIQQREVTSIERSALRYYNDRLYLFFTHDKASGLWNNSYVTAPAGDFVQLGYNLTNASTWHNLTYPGIPLGARVGKFNFIGSWNGKYYQVKDWGSGDWYGLMATGDIDGTWTNTSKILEAYNGSYPDWDSVRGDLITYDPQSSLFIVWGSAKHTPVTMRKYYWWWATSPDMTTWTFRHRMLVKSEDTHPPGNRRMPDLAIVDDGFNRSIVLVEHWDHNDDLYDSVILHHWVEPIEGPQPTTTPTAALVPFPGDANGDGLFELLVTNFPQRDGWSAMKSGV